MRAGHRFSRHAQMYMSCVRDRDVDVDVRHRYRCAWHRCTCHAQIDM